MLQLTLMKVNNMQQQSTKQVADHIARDMAKVLNDRNTVIDERVTSLERKVDDLVSDKTSQLMYNVMLGSAFIVLFVHKYILT